MFMRTRHSTVFAALFALKPTALTYDQTFAWNTSIIKETRSLDKMHQVALEEGGVVTLWHGGSEEHQQDKLKQAFEQRFPGMTLNVSVRSSSYIAPDIDLQLTSGTLYVDNIMLQTLQDYPRWRDDGVLLNYKPDGFDQIYNAFKDIDGAWISSTINAWTIIYNQDKLVDSSPPQTFLDFLKPEFKNKIVLTYPNEDDAVLHTFDLIMRRYGLEYFEALLSQEPRWVAGADIPARMLAEPNNSCSVTFTSTIGLFPQAPLVVVLPTEGAQFTSWAQRAAILKGSPHPEGAKLLQQYIISEEYQHQTRSWSTRRDVAAPAGFSSIFETPNTDPLHYAAWMDDREKIERLRFWFQDKLGYPID